MWTEAPISAVSPMRSLATLTGMSDWPRWTPSAPDAMAMSTLSLTTKYLQYSSAASLIPFACSSMTRPSAFFMRSWTMSAPPWYASLATSVSERPLESDESVTT